jgi:hypothetical protein
MVPGSPSGKVVDLNAIGRVDGVPRATASRVLATARAATIKRLSALSTGLYDSVDDALFDMAERAGNNANQARYFDGMREIRKKRHLAEAQLQEAIIRLYSDFESGKLAPSAEEMASGGTRDRGSEPLSLIDESELEETLAVSAMVDKADARLARPLYQLTQRFAALTHTERKVDHANLPIGPKLLSQAFARTLREFEIELPVKLIVLKLFERQVLANIEPLFDEVNDLLVQAGVLPNLRYQVPPQRRGETPPPKPEAKTEDPAAAAAAAAVAEDDDTAALARTEAEISGLVGELRSLLAMRRAPTGTTPSVGSLGYAPVQALNSQELLNALSLMQSEIQSQTHHGVEPAMTPAQAARVKQDLLNQVQRLGMSGNRPASLGSNEDTIDLVGMLFEYALQDRNLPAPIQALLGRLQIPYLKVALLDREFVAHRAHPARKLLDDLAHACVGWSDESDKDRRLYEKVHEIVNTLLKDFDDDTSIFQRLNTDFTDFVEKNRKRSELAEKRTAEAAHGRERLERAQRTAAREIFSRIGGRNLPPKVRDLLTRRWSNYLVLAHLRHGEDSPEWRNATRFIEDFAWSVQPKTDEHDRVKLREMTPEIERLLKQGLAATGLHENHLEELWNEVEELYVDQIAGTAEASAVTPAPDADAGDLTIRFASSKAGEEVVFSGADDDDPGAITAAEAVQALETWIKIIKALKAGTWFEFVKDDGSRERAKLLWISTIRSLYLFVNRNGIKIAEKTGKELAEELQRQRAVILEQVALVDRALGAILTRLKEDQVQKTGGTSAASSSAESKPAGNGTPAKVPSAGTPPAPEAARPNVSNEPIPRPRT